MLLKLTPEPGTPLASILMCDAIYIGELPNPRIVPLFGPNAIGKSSVIDGIIHAGNKDTSYVSKAHSFEVIRTDMRMKILIYKDRRDNARTRQPRNYSEQFDPNFLMDRFNAQSISEGQSILYSIWDLLTIIGTSKRALKSEEGWEFLVVIDELDSGLSIDNLDYVMKRLKYISIHRKDVQVIFSYNNPYVVQYFPTSISLYDGKPITFSSPDDMLAEIKSHEKEFRKKRYYSNGRPRIFN